MILSDSKFQFDSIAEPLNWEERDKKHDNGTAALE